jgi:4-amino-4-deoxy-L-arabinose transferase-like glycosyltransferase
MADLVDTTSFSPASSNVEQQQIEKPGLWGRIALGAIVLLTIFMNFYELGQNGYGNLYYASGVRSMADNWHNFFFVSFDPGGFVTIDKPPLGFWLQTLSTKIFGFTAFSIFLPQALCGVLAVILLYSLVQRHFGVVAGLIAALVLAITPITVVTDRNNTIDGTLALVLLLSAWAVIHAAETGKLRWLLLTAVFVGLGFNVKMAEAYLVVPALGLTYILCAPRKLWTRIWHLLLAALVMLIISLSWAAAVDLTPASQRPYVGSTQDNSEIDLAFGYNGLSRLHIGGSGRNGFGGGTRNTRSSTGTDGVQSSSSTTSTQTQTLSARAEGPGASDTGNGSGTTRGNRGAGGAGGAGGAAAFQTGAIGPFHLFSSSLGGQIAWLLPFALLGIVALAWQRHFRFQQDRQQLGLVLWGGWLLTMAIFFSADASFHQYYMTEMAPGLSALVGIGVVVMWHDYRGRSWHGWLLPIALAITAAVQIYLLASYPTWAQWLSPVIGIGTAIVVIALLFFRLRPRLDVRTPLFSLGRVAVSLGVLILLVAPAIWSGYSVIHNLESSFPIAGPSAQGGANAFAGLGTTGTGTGTTRDRARTGTASTTTGQNPFNGAGGFGGFGGASSQANTALISYLKANQGNTKFLLATPSSTTADTIILSTNEPVMAMGGFGGSDPILTTTTLKSLIANGTVRFFLLNATTANTTQSTTNTSRREFDFGTGGFGGGAGGFGGFGGSQQSSLTSWISSNCTAVSASKFGSSTTANMHLYDCATLRS